MKKLTLASQRPLERVGVARGPGAAGRERGLAPADRAALRGVAVDRSPRAASAVRRLERPQRRTRPSRPLPSTDSRRPTPRCAASSAPTPTRCSGCPISTWRSAARYLAGPCLPRLSVPTLPPTPTVPEPPIQPTPPPPIEPREPRTRRGDQVRFGGRARGRGRSRRRRRCGDRRIGAHRRGSARRGRRRRRQRRVGPRALVTEDIAVVGGRLERAEGARVQGELHEVSLGDIDFGDWRWGRWRRARCPDSGARSRLMSTLGRIAILCVLGALVMLLGREYVERTSLRAAAEPLKAGAIGFLAQLLPSGPAHHVRHPRRHHCRHPVAAADPVCAARARGDRAARVYVDRLPHRPVRVGAVRLGGVRSLCDDRAGSPRGRLAAAARPAAVAHGGPIVPMAFGLGVIAFVVEHVVWTIGFGAVALARLDRPRPPSAPIAAPPPVLPTAGRISGIPVGVLGTRGSHVLIQIRRSRPIGVSA